MCVLTNKFSLVITLTKLSKIKKKRSRFDKGFINKLIVMKCFQLKLKISELVQCFLIKELSSADTLWTESYHAGGFKSLKS